MPVLQKYEPEYWNEIRTNLDDLIVLILEDIKKNRILQYQFKEFGYNIVVKFYIY